MKKTLLTAFLMVLTIGAAAQTLPQWPAVTKEAKPGSRWWWLGSAVDEANLQWNIAEYARTGIGTLEITPIYGVKGNEKNELTYLSERWLQALNACQTTGDSHGVDIDMNGGTGWPFGGPRVKMAEAAGKLVTKTEVMTADGTKPLTYNVTTPEGNAPLNKVMAYRQDGDSHEAIDVTEHVSGNTLSWTAPAGQWRLLAIYNGHTLQQVKRAAPGGEGYVLDHFDADAVRNYLNYFDTQFEKFGARWPHTFFNDSYEVYGADWTPKMFDEFLKYRGYKLEDHMDQLLGYRSDEGNQVLADYRQTLSDMLLNNFTRPWAAWAHSHGATVRNQGHGSPGNLLDFYAAVDIPEIEGFGITDFKIRGLRTDGGFTSPNLSDLATLKYASSAAHVTGKPLTSSETFTWLAEHFRVSLSQMKPDLDLMFIAGVNHIFFHGTTYSPREAAWPGWKFYASIDMSPTNSIWRDAPAMMQYATRCQSFLQMGTPDNDLLVYAPFQHAMHQNTGANAARLQLFDINTLSQKIPSLVSAVKYIEAAGLDCDFISDQQLLATTWTDGKLQTAGGTRYSGLLVPVSTHLPADVKAHLDQLAAQGAPIVYDNSAAAIASFGLEGEAMRTELGLRTIRRKNASGHHYFITNLSANDAQGLVTLAVPFQGAALFDPMTGQITAAHTEDGKVYLSLQSGQSVILQTYDSPISLEEAIPVTAMKGIDIGSEWQLTFPESSTPTLFQLGNKPRTWETLDGQSAYMGTGVYETTFSVDAKTLQMGNGGFLLDLGDVRESARVFLNSDSIGTVWAAPFMIDISGKVRQQNTLRIEVTNLPANRIRQMDIDGVQWRIFKDVNILDIVGGSTSQSGVTYNNWELMPSGLNSTVRLVPLRLQATELTTQLCAFAQDGDDFFPTYSLTTPSGQPVATLSVTDTEGRPYSDFTFDAAKQQLTVTGSTPDYIVVKATDQDGTASETFLRAYGAYTQQHALDFTGDVAPLCGWTNFTSKFTINGFTTTTNYWHRASASGKELANLYDGMTFRCDNSNNYFFCPDYGMMATYDFDINLQAADGDICLLSFLKGGEPAVDYRAEDSLLSIMICNDSKAGLTLEMKGRKECYIYRTLQVYRPKQAPTGITRLTTAANDGLFYSLQGLRVKRPERGIYIRNGRKVLVR
ncbi:MAG: glycosyl hydrolase family 2 [Prevotella sp.]|nr:glycosyl hydrolase family 2 [Prevotella sp.]